MILKLKTYKYYLLILILLVINLSIFWFIDLSLVFNVHDTYFVIHYTHIIELLIIPVTIIGLTYFYFSRTRIKLIKSLSKIHTTITGSLLFILIINLYDTIFGSQFPLFDDTSNKEFVLTIIFLLILISQILLIFNIAISLIKYFKKGKRL